jgi:hypothetical protein
MKSTLKKSLAVTIVAFMLTASPFGNFILSMASAGLLSEPPLVWLSVLGNLSVKDSALSVILFLSGLLLFRQHMYSWILAICLLFGVVLMNMLYLFDLIPHYSTSSEKQHLVVGLIATLAGLVALAYLKYPFVDRRYGLLSNDVRYETSMPVEIYFGAEHVSAVLVSVSKSGAKLTWSNPNVVHQKNNKRGVLKLDNNSSFDFSVVEATQVSLRIYWISRLRNLSDFSSSGSS